MIVKRGEAIGLDWEGTMARMRQHNWEEELAAVMNKSISYPSYYTQPFHAYEQVCVWEAVGWLLIVQEAWCKAG